MRVSLLDRPPIRLGVGRGTAILLRGTCEESPAGIRRLEVLTGGAEGSAPAYRAGEEWWAIVPVSPSAAPGPLPLQLHAELESGGHVSIPLGAVELKPGAGGDGAAGGPAEEESGDQERLVAICMGTFDPPLDLFKRQIESIRRQRWKRWVCVISDDCSNPERLEQMRLILGDDPRFSLIPGERSLGFYGNFERALLLAPRDADYIALSEQGDDWYPDKLETLLGALGDQLSLAYSDMRIVTPGGEVLSETYWKHRRNKSTDLGSLLIGNTIAGAASLFRRSLLDYVLPFPPRVGDAYHDHWIALVALASGTVGYVDRPLHDHIQHPGTVMEFASANAGRTTVSVGGLQRRARRLAGRLVRPEGRRRYFEDYCRIALFATVLELRCEELLSEEKRAALKRVRSLDDSLIASGGLALRSLAPGNETMRVDRSVLAGLAWRRIARRPRSARSPRS